MEQIVVDDYLTNLPYKKAMEFTNKNFGNPDALSKKVAQFVTENVAQDGYLNRSDYDLFCFHILSQINHVLSLTGLILTKNEENEN
jgi:hypothetical protein